MNSLSIETIQDLESQYVDANGRLKGRIYSLLKLNRAAPIDYKEPTYLPPTGPSKAEPRAGNRPQKPVPNIVAYPNPAKDYLEVKWNWMELGLTSGITLQLTDLTGKRLLVERVDDHAKNVYILRTSNLANGMYVLEVKDNKGSTLFTDKIVIER